MPSPTFEQLLRELHASLTLRKRPEDVARLIQDLYAAQGTDLDTATEAALAKAAEHSLRNLWHGYTSMRGPALVSVPAGEQQGAGQAHCPLFVSDGSNAMRGPGHSGQVPAGARAVRGYGQLRPPAVP